MFQIHWEGLDSRHAVHNLNQRPWPLTSLVSASVAFMGVQVYLDLCLIFCASACAFASSSTSLSWRRGFSKDGTKAERQSCCFYQLIIICWRPSHVDTFICFNSCLVFNCMDVMTLIPYTAGDPGLMPRWGRSPGERNGNPLQYSCLENPMHKTVWWATIHGITRVGHNLATKPSERQSWNDYPCTLSWELLFMRMLNGKILSS